MPYPQRWTEDSASAWRWSVQPHSRLQSSQIIGHILLSQICSSCSSSLTLKMKNQWESFLAVLRTCLGYLHTPWQAYWTTLFATTSVQGWNPAIIIDDNLQIDKSPPHACLRAEQMWSPSWSAIYKLIQYLSDWSVSVCLPEYSLFDTLFYLDECMVHHRDVGQRHIYHRYLWLFNWIARARLTCVDHHDQPLFDFALTSY